MAVKLLSNLPVKELTKDTDYLGILDKGNRIAEFLKENKDQFDEIKMFSLYGEWGSGKSSLMKYLQHQLKGEFNTYFFEAWEFEKDENLALSLLQFLIKSSPNPNEDLRQDLLKLGGRILRGLAKSVKFKATIPLIGQADIDLAGMVPDNHEQELDFFDALKKFKQDFEKFEDNNEGKPNASAFHIVFVDDLDRCEPNQVLNLLSAIKLFFTYGKKTVFFCGIDKKAVEEAVKTKYGEIVLANEYLEKIFDISFSMPEYVDIGKMIEYYFDRTLYKVSDEEKPISEWVNGFFTYIEFTNPRRVKKVLNKFQMLRNYKEKEKKPDFPNIDEHNGKEQSYFETILVLYLIILHEFHPTYFNGFINPTVKKANYYKALKSSDFKKEDNSPTGLESLTKTILSVFHEKKFDDLRLDSNNVPSFNICLAPSDMEQFTFESLVNKVDEMQAKDNTLEYLFYRYTIKYKFSEIFNRNCSEASFSSIKKLIRDAL